MKIRFKLMVCILSVVFTCGSRAQDWYPLQIDVWDPAFNDSRERKTVSYVPLKAASQPWKICVSIPHLKDAYWLVVNFALIEEAKRLGIRMRINEAGGYSNLDIQRRQIESCMGSGADGLILSATDATGVNDLIDKYRANGQPVIDLINGVKTKNITARAAATYFDNAQLTAKYIKKTSQGTKKTVLWLPGPKGPIWSSEADDGFKFELKDSSISIVDTLWGDTGKEVQGELIRQALSQYENIDYIVGTTVSSDAAVGILKKMNLSKQIKILAYYYDPTVHRHISRGNVVAGAVDQQAIQAKLAVDMVVRSLDGKLEIKHAGPKILLVDKYNIQNFDSSYSIPPKGFRPVFSLKDWVRK